MIVKSNVELQNLSDYESCSSTEEVCSLKGTNKSFIENDSFTSANTINLAEIETARLNAELSVIESVENGLSVDSFIASASDISVELDNDCGKPVELCNKTFNDNVVINDAQSIINNNLDSVTTMTAINNDNQLNVIQCADSNDPDEDNLLNSIDSICLNLSKENFNEKFDIFVNRTTITKQIYAKTLNIEENTIHYLLDQILNNYENNSEELKLFSKFINNFVQCLLLPDQAIKFKEILLNQMKILYQKNPLAEPNESSDTVKTRNQIAKWTSEQMAIMKKYEANLLLINELFEIDFIDGKYLTDCMNHLIDQLELINHSNGNDRCVKNFLYTIQAFFAIAELNLHRLEGQCREMVNYYQQTKMRLNQLLKSQPTPTIPQTIAGSILKYLNAQDED